jgi:hypothetical protein
MKNLFNWFLIHLSPLVLIAWLSNYFLGPSHYRMNDDSIISWFVSGDESFGDNPITVYTGIIYGYLINSLSAFYPNFEWHGLSQILILIFIFSLLTYFISKNEKISKSTSVVSILLIWIYVAWYTPSPTYTMTSLSLGITALIFLIFFIFTESLEWKFKFIIISIITQTLSLLYRADGYYLSVVVVSGMILYLFIYHSKSQTNLLFLAINVLTIFSIHQIDIYLHDKEVNSSRAWSKFNEFNLQYSKIKTNPAELDFYELIANEKAEKIQWDNVDALVFQSNSFFDDQVFSAQELAAGLSQIEDRLGVRGLLNKNFSSSLARTLSYLEESRFHLFLITSLFLSLLFLKLRFRQKILLFFLSASPFYFIFYFLGAVSRLPLRVHFPVIIFLILFMLIYVSLIVPDLNYKNKIFLNLVGLAAIFSFIFSPHNLLSIRDHNTKLKNNLDITVNIMQGINRDGIFIGQILAFPETATLAYRKMPDNGVRYLTSGWFTFSPPWYQKLYELDLINDDPYLALAQQPNVYWVSDAYTAEVLNMYMNNKNIFRKNLCLIETIPYNLGIYTFQSEQQCSK